MPYLNQPQTTQQSSLDFTSVSDLLDRDKSPKTRPTFSVTTQVFGGAGSTRSSLPNNVPASAFSVPEQRTSTSICFGSGDTMHMDGAAWALDCHELSFRTETKKVFMCTYQSCETAFNRVHDLYRHHRSVHRKENWFTCRYAGCARAMRGFPRKDKRNDHEKKVHKGIWTLTAAGSA